MKTETVRAALCMTAVYFVAQVLAQQPEKLRKGVNDQLAQTMEDGLKLDVAVIGAGMSGLYSAWRLSGTEAGPNKKKAQIFELSDKIGGRLQSVTIPGMSVVGELGGMRYLNTQKMITTLIEQNFQSLFQSTEFEMGDEEGKGLLFYGRGQRLFQSAWTDAQKNGTILKTRYAVNSKVEGFSANQMYNKVIGDVLLADPWFNETYPGRVAVQNKYNYFINISIQEFDDIKTKLVYNFEGPYKGLKVNALGFWNLIDDQLGEEAYQFLSDAGGYYSNTGSVNSAEAFANMIADYSSPNIKYKTIVGGFDQLAYGIAEKYLRQNGSKIWIKNALETFEKEPSGSDYRYKLTIRNIDSDTTWTVYANAIVLGLPPRSLELLNQNNFFFKPSKNNKLHSNMATLIRQPSLKLLMGFEKAWWANEFGPSGHSITNLPMRQCYYFGIDSNNSHALFLASYNDMRSVTFWKPLEPSEHREFFTPTGTSLVHSDELTPLHSVQATKSMVQEAMKQVREVHGKNKQQIPDPYVTWFKDWSQDPYGAGYHFWKAGVNVGAVMRFMRKPLDTEAIHVSGEAYSDAQGWVEGAFAVAENMLQEHFNLTRPTWLDSNYYLGW